MVPEEAIDDKDELNESDAAAAVAAVAAAVQEKKDHDESVKAADVLRQTLEGHVDNHVANDNGHVTQEHVSNEHEHPSHVPEASHVHHGMTAINQHVTQQHSQQPHVSQPYELDLNPYQQQGPNSKPPVGSEQWHQMRRDNHKEVERRRRETINEGINTLAELIATSEKNKGQILKNAIEFIRQLKEQDDSRTQKAAMDKFSLMNQVTETSAQNNRLKIELQRAWREAETWKGKFQELEGKKSSE